MDTPERSKVAGAGGAATPLSKFEDSPVFNFINNLSPIQPVRSVDSVHITHTYQTLNFASLTSIFSSPHVNPQKENKSLVRAPFTDFSKQDTFCQNVERNPNSGTSASVRLSTCSIAAEDDSTRETSVGKASAIPTDERTAVPSSMMQLSQGDSGSPNHNTTPSYAMEVDSKFNGDLTSEELVQFVENGMESAETLFSMETVMQENIVHRENKDGQLGCDWGNLIGDDAEGLLIFNSPIGSDAYRGSRGKAMDKNVDSHCSLLSKATENPDKLQDNKSDTSNGYSAINASDDPLPNCSEDMGMEDGTENASTTISGNCENKVVNQQQRGIRRRCLVFEGAGNSRSNICQDSSHDPLIALASKDKNFCANKLKPAITPPPCLLPGIGLHLNTLSTSSKDRIVSKKEMTIGDHVLNMPNPICPLLPITSGQKILHNSVVVEKDIHNSDKEIEDPQPMHDEASQTNTLELSQGSPKKKRRKLENGSESDGCKRCNCKKSKCLKLYCECFAAGVYCSEPCSCHGCFNKPIHEETVLSTRKQIESRNPLAFAPKVIRTSESGQEMGDDDNKTPASARHKRGCNCKKSSCLKKYCECYQGGVGCSLSCRCEGCKNAFGRKDGILLIGEIEQTEEGIDVLEKGDDRIEENKQNANVQIDEQPPDSILPITPFENCRLSIDLPFFSSAKPPRSSKLSVGSSPGLYGSHMLQKSDILLSQHKFENNLNTVHEDDTPAILRTTASPTNVVKSVSPNSKRISPPHNAIGPSPARKGGRKLILKSIPSFPSLSNDVSINCPTSYPDGSLSSI